MTKGSGDSDLHERAETWLRTARGEDEATPTDVLQGFVYDLQVYQVELAMQHEELRRVESELERSKDRYRSLYELAPVAYLTLDEAGRIIECNQLASTLLGIERGQLCGSSFADRIVPGERPGFYEQHQGVLGLHSPRSYELTLATKPLQRAVRCEAQHGLTADGQRCVLLVLCDITEQRLADTALRAEMTQRALTEANLRRERDFAEGLLATTPGLFIELNRQGRILRCNRNFEQLTGYRSEEIRGAEAFALLLSQPTRDEARTRFAVLMQGPQATPGPAVTPITPMLTRKGLERQVTWTFTVQCSEQGQPTGVLLIGIDMTEQQRLEAELQQAQKMEAIGQLASGIAHDFNNLLLGQAGLAEIAASKLPADSPVQVYLTQIKQALSGGAGLTRQLLDFARKRPAERVSVDLSRLVERSGALLRCLLPRNIELRFELGQSVWVTGDPGQLEQVLFNLFANARDALPEGGTLRVATADGCSHGEPNEPQHASDRYAMLTVSDNGVGMDEETQRRAYEPFFTTKKPGAGAGLGLATVYGIVLQSSGHIYLRSQPGQGTTFYICLPRAEPLPSAEPPPLPPTLLGSGETILLIEDEATVRALCRHRLQGQGYRVLEAENGDQALELCRSSEPIALALTDIILPGAPGDEVARAMTALRPELLILYMSALPTEQLIREGRLDARAVALQKPFSEHDLLTRVSELVRPRARPALVPEALAAHGPRVVLLVEDDGANRMLLQELLELADYAVLTAGGAEEALEVLATQPRVDLLVTDFGLPGKHGLALLTELLPSHPALQAILITGRPLHDPLLAGAAQISRLRLMRKPFELEAFLVTVAELLAEVQ